MVTSIIINRYSNECQPIIANVTLNYISIHLVREKPSVCAINLYNQYNKKSYIKIDTRHHSAAGK